MTQIGVDLNDLKRAVENEIKADNILDANASVQLLGAAEKSLKMVYLEARSMGSSTINTGHLLLSLLKDEKSLISKILNDFELSYSTVKTRLMEHHQRQTEARSDLPGDSDDDSSDFFSHKSSSVNNKTTNVDADLRFSPRCNSRWTNHSSK